MDTNPPCRQSTERLRRGRCSRLPPRRHPNQIDRKTYGAGLGLYLVANAAASYVVNVAYGIATEVVCTFDRGAKSPLRLVGMFVHPGGAEMLKRGPTPETAAGLNRGG